MLSLASEGLDSLLVEGMPTCNVTTPVAAGGEGEGGEGGVTFNNVLVASIEYRLPPEHKVVVHTTSNSINPGLNEISSKRLPNALACKIIFDTHVSGK